MSDALLKIDNIEVNYGRSQALFGVSMEMNAGSMTAVLGANGAGKSTLARAVAGLVPVAKGDVYFDGNKISGLPAYKIRRLGLTYIPEGRGIFPGLTVNENLRMAVGQEKRADRSAAMDRAIEMFPVLGSRRNQRAGSLSGGEQQMLALARALAVPPKLIIADEMSLGLAPIVTEAVFQSLDDARKSGITILLIEQFVNRALSLADHATILTHGEVSWSGPAADAHQEVLDRYLGAGANASEDPAA
jgi:branched-chain amino acid transport system ATP-binding protein